MGITHSKVSAKSDGGDTSLVRPSDWNAGHTIADITANATTLDTGVTVSGSARPRVILDSGNTVKTRVFQRESGWYRGGLSVNLSWPGQYDLDDTGRAGWHLVLDADGDFLAISRASAGSNPRTPSELLRIDSAGRVILGGSSGPAIITGSGSPNSVVSAPVGSLYLRTDGSAGSTLWVKESGTGNTGWGAK